MDLEPPILDDMGTSNPANLADLGGLSGDLELTKYGSSTTIDIRDPTTIEVPLLEEEEPSDEIVTPPPLAIEVPLLEEEEPSDEIVTDFMPPPPIVGNEVSDPLVLEDVHVETTVTPTSPSIPTESMLPQQTSVGNEAPTPFKPSLGAWTKPLNITSTLPPKDLYHSNPLGTFWPTLNAGTSEYPQKKTSIKPIGVTSLLPIEKLPPPELKADGSLRFPWAARVNPASRNLFRAAAPSYLTDGTPQVSIPSNVLLNGPENQAEYVIGQFCKCSPPPGGLIHVVVNKLWGRNCRIFSKKLGESSYLFHIPDIDTRNWVIQRGLWHIDDCLLFVGPWCPAATLSLPDISTIPIWVNLKNIPDRLYSRLGISHIASGLGEPILTNKPRLDPTLMGEAKIMVEVELDKPFPQKIALDDQRGNTFMVDVEYTWIPSKCGRCGQLGHKEKRCLLPKTHKSQSSPSEARFSDVAPVVDVHHLLESTSLATKEQSKTPKNTVFDKPQDIPHHAAQNSGSYIVINAPPSSQHHKNTYATRETTTLLHQLMIPVMGSPVASAYSDRVPAPHGDIHSSISGKNKESNASIEVFASPNNGSASKTQETTPTNERSCSQTLDATETPITANLAVQTNTISMEGTPSSNIIPGIFLSGMDQLVSKSLAVNFDTPPRATGTSLESGFVGEDENGNGPLRHTTLDAYFRTTRGGRPIKPSQKLQEMEWTTVRGRGNRGRRGRGSQNSFS